jgi:trigger factor
MHHTLERLPKNQVKITVTLTKEEVEAGMNHAVEHMGADVTLPGFRPGHAPASAIRAKIGEDKLFEHAIEEMIRDSFSAIMLEEDLAAVGQPFFAPVKMAVGQEFIYSAEVSLMPSVIKLGDYKKVTISAADLSVKPEEFARAKEDLRRLRQQESPAAEGVQATKGDKVTVDLSMKQKGVMIEGGDAKNHHVYTAEEHYIPGFTDALIGLTVGETKTFTLDFPADHPQKHLAGQPVEFTVAVTAINKLMLPTWNDDFAKELGLDSVSALENKFQENLTLERQNNDIARQERELLETIANTSTFDEFSDLLVNQEIEKMVQELQQWTEEQGIAFEDYLKSLGKSLAELKLEFTPQAIMRLKVALVIEEIAKKEQIAADNSAVDAEIDRLAAGMKGNDQVREYLYSPAFRERITAQQRNKAVIEQLKTWNIAKNG